MGLIVANHKLTAEYCTLFDGINQFAFKYVHEYRNTYRDFMLDYWTLSVLQNVHRKYGYVFVSLYGTKRRREKRVAVFSSPTQVK